MVLERARDIWFDVLDMVKGTAIGEEGPTWLRCRGEPLAAVGDWGTFRAGRAGT